MASLQVVMICQIHKLRAIAHLALIQLLSLYPGPGAHGQQEPATAHTQHEILSTEQRAWLDTQGNSFTVALEPSYRPYAYIDEQGEAAGIVRDYLDIISSRLNVEFVAKRYESFADVVQAARERDVDIVPFIVDNPERHDFLLFTTGFYAILDRILTRTDQPTIDSLTDLQGMRVGVIEGYGGAAEVEAAQNLELVPQPNELYGVRALAVGNIDALIADLGVVSYHMTKENISNIRVAAAFREPDMQSFAVRSDLPELVEALQAALDTISEAEHRAIQDHYVGFESIDTGPLNIQIRLLLAFVVVLLAAVMLFVLWSHSLRVQVSGKTAALESELDARRAIESENSRLISAINQSLEYMMVVNGLGEIEYANSVAKAKFDIDDAGHFIDSLGYESDQQKLTGALAQGREGKSWRGELSLRDVNDAAVHVAMTLSPIQDDSFEPKGFVATARDLSAEDELASRLQHSEKISALGTLASGIAHDFNNLLVPILSYSESLLASAPDSSRQALNSINQAATRAQQLVQRILTFSRQQEANRSDFDVTNEIAEGIQLLDRLLPSSIKINVDIEPSLYIRGEPHQIQQILLNLGTNAADAMELNTGRLDIELKRCAKDEEIPEALAFHSAGPYCCLTVTDNGSGMSEQQQQKMFDPYFTNKPRGKGTGLGLATVHGLVASHQGVITVVSSLGVGTTIKIFFPLIEHQQQEVVVKANPTAEQNKTRGAGRQVLLVDDDELVLETVGTMMTALDYEVTMQSGPKEALAMIEQNPARFDILISDVTMPELNGIELAAAAHNCNPALPVILMTGHTDLVTPDSITTLAKPFNLSELSTTVADCLTKA